MSMSNGNLQAVRPNGDIVQKNEELVDYRGTPWLFVRAVSPTDAGHAGKIEVRQPDEAVSNRIFYATVFGDLSVLTVGEE